MLLLTWLKSTVLVALIVFLGFGSYFFWTTAQSEKQLSNQATATFTAANAAITNINSATVQLSSAVSNLSTSIAQTELDVRGVTTSLQGAAFGLQKTIALVNAPCVPIRGQVLSVTDDKPCGVIANLNTTLHTFRGTAGTLESAGLHWDKNLSTLDTQEASLFVDFDTLAKTGNSDASDLDALLKRQALQNFVDNLGPLSANFVAITGTGEHMLQTGDAVETKATGSYLHPSKNPWVRDWKATYPWLLIGAQGVVKWAPVVP